MGIGDELMSAGRAEGMLRASGRRVKILGKDDRPRWHPLWNGNPAIGRPDEEGEFDLLKDCGYFRPYMREIGQVQYRFQRYRPKPASLYFTDAELAFGVAHAGKVILEPNLKPRAPRNKDWGWERWLLLVERLRDLPLAQLGMADTRLLPDVPLIETPDFRQAAAVLKFARAYVGHEGFLHHVAAAVRTPAVVIFGGFISPEVTGYREHRNLFSAVGLGCGRRIPCDHCDAAMAAITPEMVERELRECLDQTVAA